MNILPKGILTVVFATIVASILILFAGKTVADGALTSEKASMASTQETMFNKSSSKAAIDYQAVDTAVKKPSTVPPPVGPFGLLPPIPSFSKNIPDNKKPLAVSAPPSPQNNAVINKPLMTFDKPNLQAIEPSQKKPPLLKNHIDQLVKATAPELKKTMPAMPVEPEKTITPPAMRHIAPSQPVRPRNQPIWAQKASPVKPHSPVTEHKVMQAPVLRYMYIPVPVYQQQQNYPQMPVYGAYNYLSNTMKINKTHQPMPVNPPKLNTNIGENKK